MNLATGELYKVTAVGTGGSDEGHRCSRRRFQGYQAGRQGQSSRLQGRG